MAARAVTQLYDTALQPAGLKATQFTVLAKLDSLGAQPVTRLAETLILDRTTLTRNLKPLERDGLVRIVPEADQRVRKVSITDAGRQRLETCLPLWEQAQNRIHARLGTAPWSDLMDGLEETIAAAGSG